MVLLATRSRPVLGSITPAGAVSRLCLSIVMNSELPGVAGSRNCKKLLLRLLLSSPRGTLPAPGRSCQVLPAAPAAGRARHPLKRAGTHETKRATLAPVPIVAFHGVVPCLCAPVAAGTT